MVDIVTSIEVVDPYVHDQCYNLSTISSDNQLTLFVVLVGIDLAKSNKTILNSKLILVSSESINILIFLDHEIINSLSMLVNCNDLKMYLLRQITKASLKLVGVDARILKVKFSEIAIA